MGSAKLKDGRRWSVGAGGLRSLKRKYLVVVDGVTAANGEAASFQGVPAIGSTHPVHTNLVVDGYEVEEGENSAKNTLVITVNYEERTSETSGEGQAAVSMQVENWGWDSGTEDREFTDAVDGTPVTNSAGDIYDRVPTISVPAPTFTKTMKFRNRQSGAMAFSCKVNNSSVTIGDRTYPIGSLLCNVNEQRVFGDAEWKYRYTVQLKFRTNPVKLSGSNSATDIGWDVAITDAGMREKDATTGKLKLIKAVDSETGKKCTVTSPELLDGNGHAVSRTSGSTPRPYNVRYQAYERATFPNWFYSEPT